MAYDDTLRTVGTVIYVAMAAVGTLSVIVHSRVRWWATQMGRHVMVYMLSIAVVLDLGVIRLLVGDTAWFAAVRVAALAVVLAAMTQRLYLQVAARRGRLTAVRTPDERRPS